MMILKTSRSNLSSNDQLSLDLPFAATKSLTARVGPTPTFTRGSGATYIGSDGLIHGIDTSTTSNSISAASKTFTLAATAGQDQLWRTGDAVEASNGSNIMTGTVTSYNATTQSLVCNMTTASGSGTFTSWRIGYRGPRFDHTSAGVCRGLLIEEGRTNYLVHSQDFQNWSTSGSVVSRNKELTIADPSGGFTANRIVGNSAASVYRDPVNGVPVGNRSNSIYARAVTGGVNRIEISGTGIFVRVNLETGSLISSSGVVAGSVVIQPIGSIGPDGYTWYRISAVPTSTTIASMYLSPNPTVFTGDRDLFLLWGAQLEVGSFPTSYIPTTTGTLARGADVCSITGANFTSFYNQSEGTFLSSTQLFSVGNDYSARYWNVSNPPNYMRVSVFGQTSTQESSFLQNDDSTLNSTVSSELSRISRVAGAYQLNNARIVKNGTLGVLDTAFTPYTSFNNLGIMTSASGTIASLRYYRKRLPDAKLQALTV
jgi:hypothetical protein